MNLKKVVLCITRKITTNIKTFKEFKKKKKKTIIRIVILPFSQGYCIPSKTTESF